MDSAPLNWLVRSDKMVNIRREEQCSNEQDDDDEEESTTTTTLVDISKGAERKKRTQMDAGEIALNRHIVCAKRASENKLFHHR